MTSVNTCKQLRVQRLTCVANIMQRSTETARGHTLTEPAQGARSMQLARGKNLRIIARYCSLLHYFSALITVFLTFWHTLRVGAVAARLPDTHRGTTTSHPHQGHPLTSAGTNSIYDGICPFMSVGVGTSMGGATRGRFDSSCPQPAAIRKWQKLRFGLMVHWGPCVRPSSSLHYFF